MPRPHYPAQGGPHVPAWNAAYARLPRRPELFAPPVHEEVNNSVCNPGIPDANGRVISPFLPRLDAQMEQGQTGQMQSGHLLPMAQEHSRLRAAATTTQVLRDTPKTGTAPSARAIPYSPNTLPEEFFKRHGVVWLAAVLCALAVVFAFLAVRWHG